MKRPIELTEVGPRDGLQNEPGVIPTDRKVAFVDALSQTGVREIEVSSFVSPRWVPQLADAEEVFRRIQRREGVIYSALVPNLKGLERALSVGVDKIAVFTAASETFNRKNINASIQESLARFRPVIREALAAGLPVRGYVSTAFHCPYEGEIPPEQVLPVVEALLELGVEEVSLGDTIGKASPADVRRLMDVLLPRIPVEKVVLHFHATYGMALANVMVAWEEYGIFRFDASAGGLGGCPYAPGASGNVATEDVVYALQRMGADVRVDLEKVIQAVKDLHSHLVHPPHSHLYAVRMGGT